MGSIVFQLGFNSGGCLRIQELGFRWGVIIFEYGKLLGYCCPSQYNLIDRVLQIDANTTVNESYVFCINLVVISISFTYYWDSGPW